MSTILQDDQFFNNEVNFCRLYSYVAKKNLERIFLKHRISYFIEWQNKSFFQKLFRQGYSKKKALCTVRINTADVERAYDFTKELSEIKYTEAVDKYIAKDGIRTENDLKAAESTWQGENSFDNEKNAGHGENSFDNERNAGHGEDSFDNERNAGHGEDSFDNEKDAGQHEDGTI